MQVLRGSNIKFLITTTTTSIALVHSLLFYQTCMYSSSYTITRSVATVTVLSLSKQSVSITTMSAQQQQHEGEIGRENDPYNRMNQENSSFDDNHNASTEDWKIQTNVRKKKSTNRQQNRQYHDTANTGNKKNNPIDYDNIQVPEWMMKLPCQIPPQPLNHQHEQQQQQHILLLMGYPGCGKTTLATTLCRILPWRYVHVNQDVLKTRPACIKETQSILDNGYCPIIDRCNISIQQRQYFTQFQLTNQDQQQQQQQHKSDDGTSELVTTLSATTKYVPVDCIVLKHVSIKECIQRCKKRLHHPTLPPEKVEKVIGIMKHEYQEPIINIPTNASSTGNPNIDSPSTLMTQRHKTSRSNQKQKQGRSSTASNQKDNKNKDVEKELLRTVHIIDSDSMLQQIVQEIVYNATNTTCFNENSTSTTNKDIASTIIATPSSIEEEEEDLLLDALESKMTEMTLPVEEAK